MAKSREQRYSEYRANRDHEVGSEAFMTDREIETKRRIEAFGREYAAKPKEEPEVKRAKSLDELAEKSFKKYNNIRG